MTFIDPIRYPVAASEAATRAMRDQAAAAYHAGHLLPPSVNWTAVPPPPSPAQLAEQAADQQAALVRWRADRARALAQLGTHTIWEERLVLAARHWTSEGGPWPASCVANWDPGIFSAAFPELWATPAEVHLGGAPWDSPALARWFAANALAQKVPRVGSPYPVGGGLFGRKNEQVWWFDSTRWGPGMHHTGPKPKSVVVTRKGLLLPPGEKIAAYGLRRMAEKLDLADPALDISWPMTSDGKLVKLPPEGFPTDG